MDAVPPLDPDSLDLARYCDQWLAQMRGRVRPSTIRSYEGVLRLYVLPALGAVPLAQLHPLHFQNLYGDLLVSGGHKTKPGLSAGTVLNIHRVLVQALGWACRWGLIASNPAVAARPPRPRRPEPSAVDPDLAERILKAATGTRLEVPVAIALSTGMRRGEILGLRWGDLDAGYTVAHVRRTLQPAGGLAFHYPGLRTSLESERGVIRKGLFRKPSRSALSSRPSSVSPRCRSN